MGKEKQIKVGDVVAWRPGMTAEDAARLLGGGA